MSLILRNHCLQGQVKNDYQNLTDFKMIEDRLDEEYLDKERVVDMVTQQLTEARPIKWDDYNGFIQHGGDGPFGSGGGWQFYYDEQPHDSAID